jgi:hypothetical protein
VVAPVDTIGWTSAERTTLRRLAGLIMRMGHLRIDAFRR